MTEKEFFDEIEIRTGWTMFSPSKDRAFGIIVGTMMPFVAVDRMMPSSRNPGITVWKRQDNVGVEKDIRFKDSRDAVDQICKFLQEPFPVINKDAGFKLVGEYQAE